MQFLPELIHIRFLFREIYIVILNVERNNRYCINGMLQIQHVRHDAKMCSYWKYTEYIVIVMITRFMLTYLRMLPLVHYPMSPCMIYVPSSYITGVIRGLH